MSIVNREPPNDPIFSIAAKALTDYAGSTTTIYLLEARKKTPSPSTVARVGGEPIGVHADNWPRFNGQPMEHLLTLDLEQMPQLRVGALKHTRAVALFISDAIYNMAFDPYTQETAVIFLSEQDIARGETTQMLREGNIIPYTYDILGVEVPDAIFDEQLCQEKPFEVLWGEVKWAFGRAGGKPLWFQFPEHEGDFLMQFDGRFIDMNLGDAGVMFVFTDTAFWQGA